jgi:Family of unknown function (DUF6308)
MAHETTLRLERMSRNGPGDLLVLDGMGLACQFFEAVSSGFDDLAGATTPNRISRADIDLLNQVMGTRSPVVHWESFFGRPLRFLERLDPQLDLIRASDRHWRQVGAEQHVGAAIAALSGANRGPATVTKLLHLKRPRLFPIVDRLTREVLGAPRPAAVEGFGDTEWLVQLVLHLREQGRRNLPALKLIQHQLRAVGVDRSLIRIIDTVLWASHPAAGGSAVTGRVIAVSSPRRRRG